MDTAKWAEDCQNEANLENEFNIVIIGPTGAGKSSTVNNMLENMQEVAQVGMSGESCTKVPKIYTGSMCGRKINLIDT